MGLKFTQLQKDLIIGSLLGDGNMQTLNGRTWRFRVLHKADHETYVNHKFEIVKNFCATNPKYYSFLDDRTKKSYDRYSFSTLSSVNLKFFGCMFYKKEGFNWKKKVPTNIHTFLTPRALAYWYMDDGALKWKGHSNAVRLCTDSFSLDEVHSLKNVLETKFFLKVSIQKKGNIYRLCILEESYPILNNLIAKYLIPCMYYKFPNGNKGIYNI